MFTPIIKSSACLLFLRIGWSLFWYAKRAFVLRQTLFLPKPKHEEFRSPFDSKYSGLVVFKCPWHAVWLLAFTDIYLNFWLIFYTIRGIMYRCTYGFLQCCTLFNSGLVSSDLILEIFLAFLLGSGIAYWYIINFCSFQIQIVRRQANEIILPSMKIH